MDHGRHSYSIQQLDAAERPTYRSKRTKRKHSTALDRETKNGPCHSVFPWYVSRLCHKIIQFISEGGAFLLPMQYFTTSFWEYIQAALKKKNIDAGIAILNYSKFLLLRNSIDQITELISPRPICHFSYSAQTSCSSDRTPHIQRGTAAEHPNRRRLRGCQSCTAAHLPHPPPAQRRSPSRSSFPHPRCLPNVALDFFNRYRGVHDIERQE